MSLLTCANPACGRAFRPSPQQAFLHANYPHHRSYCSLACRAAHQRKAAGPLVCAGCGASYTPNAKQAQRYRTRLPRRTFCPACVGARDRRGPQGWDGPAFGSVGKAGTIDHDNIDRGKPDRGRDAPAARRPGDVTPVQRGLDPLRDAG